MKLLAYLGGSRNRGQDITEAGSNVEGPLPRDAPPLPRLHSIKVLEPPKRVPADGNQAFQHLSLWRHHTFKQQHVGSALPPSFTCAAFFCVIKCQSKGSVPWLRLVLKILHSSGGPWTVCFWSSGV